jgi:BMFP domain-containing protein YqiC
VKPPAEKMIDVSKIDELAERLGDLLPSGAQQIREDLEAQFKGVLGKAFGKMDLVTREEFDIQKAVLERAMIKLQALDQQLADLEANRSP